MRINIILLLIITVTTGYCKHFDMQPCPILCYLYADFMDILWNVYDSFQKMFSWIALLGWILLDPTMFVLG